MSSQPAKKRKVESKSSGMTLKAIILVGGYGTRLRPLTFTCPKPLVEFANKPIVMHQIEALVKVGVTEIILAVNYQPQKLEDFLKIASAKFGISIKTSKEEVPMGTAGPLYLAKSHLESADSFFMFNSDVICTYPLQEMLDFHRNHAKQGTIFVTPVEDPSKYGVVVSQDDGRINQFVEKPKEFVGDKINAGIYLFNPSMISRVPNQPTSIERVIFPAMASEGELYAMTLPGYWMDIGQPKDYLRGMVLHLDSISDELKSESKGYEKRGNVLVHESATIGNGCVLGPDVVIGPNVVLGEGVRVTRSTLLADVRVENGVYIKSSIIGWETRVGRWARCVDCVIGADVNVKPELSLSGVTVCPHKGVKADATNKIIL